MSASTRVLADGWEAVYATYGGRRRVVYYRLPDPDRPGAHLGAVSKRDEGWRALAYGRATNDRRLGRPSRSGKNTDLGMHETKLRAQRAVEAHVSVNGR